MPYDAYIKRINEWNKNNQVYVALTGGNTTGPTSRATGELRCIYAGVRDDDKRQRQTPATVTSLVHLRCMYAGQ